MHATRLLYPHIFTRHMCTRMSMCIQDRYKNNVLIHSNSHATCISWTWQLRSVERAFLNAAHLRRIPCRLLLYITYPLSTSHLCPPYISVYTTYIRNLASTHLRNTHAPMCINTYNIHQHFCMHAYSHDTCTHRRCHMHASQVPSVDTLSFIPLTSAVYPPCVRAERTAQTQEALRLFALHLHAPDLALPPAAHATPLHDVLDSLCAAALAKPSHPAFDLLQVGVTGCVGCFALQVVLVVPVSVASCLSCFVNTLYVYVCVYMHIYIYILIYA